MKKIYLIIGALFCAISLFTGCSDKDDDGAGGNGQGAGNGGSGVTVLPKKIAKVVVSYNGQNQTTDLYQYDTKGRLSKITSTYGASEEVQEFTYTDNQITIKEDGKLMENIVLKNGYVTTSQDYDGNSYRSDYTYSYSGNYLSKIEGKDFKKNGENWEADGSDQTTFSVENGNLKSSRYSYIYNGKENGVTGTLEYGNVANNANIDLYGFIMGDNVYLLCVAGARYKNLPSKVTSKEDDYDADVTTYAYEVDKDGYVVKVTETEIEDENDISVYTITYE